MPSYDRTHCSCLLSRDYLADVSSLYRRYYVLQQTVLLAEQSGTKKHPAFCPKHPNKKTSLPMRELIPLIEGQEKIIAQTFSNLRKRKVQWDNAIKGNCCHILILT